LSARRLLLHLLACLLFGFAATATAAPPLDDAGVAATAPTRILVMLRMPPEHHHARGSYGGAYGNTASREARQRIAKRIASDNGLALVDSWPMPILGVDCFVMQIANGASQDEVIARVSKDHDVAWSQPLGEFHTRSGPTSHVDPLFPTQPAAGAWRLADLHRIATGRGISVAVIDSQVQLDHPDLSGQIAERADFVPGHASAAEQHGTGIAGVIVAREGNGVGIVGVAPGARLMALRACWQTGADGTTRCDSLSLARALQFSIEHRAQVVNMSLSGPNDILLAKLIDIALERGISVVAAFDPSLPKGGFPASLAGVVAVADEALPSLPSVVYGAPGRDVPTTEPGGRWYLVDGSSYAAAHISGLLALIRERHEPIDLVTGPRDRVVDACASLLRTSASCDCDCAVAQNEHHRH
jgi:subtilisin family serine protease